nr:translocator protein [Hymenolepis microstoma]
MSVYEAVRAAGCVGLPYLGGVVGSPITKRNMEWYKSLNKPFLSPPSWVFAPAWSFLYGSMGLASLYVLQASDRGADVTLPLCVYGSQLLLNWSWTPIYFGLKKFNTSIAVILATTFGASASAYLFYQIDHKAGYLMLPYIAWMCFASYLNISSAILNRDKKPADDVDTQAKQE